MKILQLCKKFPYPLNDGESIAVSYLSQALAEDNCEIYLLSMNTSKHYVDIDKLHSELSYYKEIHSVGVDNQINPVGALSNLFSRKSYHVSRFESDAFHNKLKELLTANKFDIIQLETLFLAPYLETIRKYSDGLVVMRAHNVEHEIWDRIGSNTKFLPKKWYINYLSHKLRRFEINNLNEYDFLVPISDADLVKFRSLGYINGAKSIPIGLNLSDYRPNQTSLETKLSMAFIGSLDWMPNSEGINWFVRKIWPHLNHRFPKIELHIAGRNTPNVVSQLQSLDRVIVHGEVEDAKVFLNEHPILVVPLLSGSGMRAKILEGMALGRVVITTSIGLEGIDAEHGKEVLVADDVREFVEALQFCHGNRKGMIEIAENGYKFVHERYDNKSLARLLKNSLHKYAASRN